MLQKKKATILIFFTTLLLALSCKRETVIKKLLDEKNTKKRIECKIEFPDTVYLNESYNGVVKYKSILDTITTSFDDKKKKRYPIFYLTIVEKPNLDYKKLKKDAKMFGAHNNREIPFYDIKFTKSGTYYIDGIINDFAVIDINKKDSKGNELVREIENEERVIHKVVVIEKPE